MPAQDPGAPTQYGTHSGVQTGMAGGLKPNRMHMAGMALAALLMLAGCDTASDDGVGGVTKGEAQALNEAAEMLDSRPSVTNMTNDTNAPQP